MTLSDVAVTDAMVSPITCPSGNPIPSLAAGASESCTGTYTVTQADVDAGQKDNTADATGDDPGGNPVSDQDSHSEPIVQVPALDLVKSAAPPTYDTIGQIISYSYQVTNVGNVVIDNLTVADDNDDEPAGVSCPVTTLAPGVSTTCTAQRTVTQADVDAGSITNTAIASGTDPGANPVNSPPDSETVTSVVSNPAIQLIKTGALDVVGNGASNPGDLINYTFEVTNTGDVVLTDVTVTDPMVSPITCPSGNPIPSLGVGASETCTGSYAITQADIDAGQKDNTANATGQDPGGNPVSDDDSHSEPIPANVPQEVPCTGEAFIVQDINAQLTQVDQSVSPFAFIDIGIPAGLEYNNLGFRRTDGLLYAVELNPGGNTQIVQIDRNGVVFGLGRPAVLPPGPRFDGGDVSTDGTITTVNQDLYVLDLTSVPTLPPVTVVTRSGHLDTELVNQVPTQGLTTGTIATVTVTLEVLTFTNLNGDGEFCNQILVTGETADGTLFGDLSTDGIDPDPDSDGSPDERDLSCVGFTPPADSMSLNGLGRPAGLPTGPRFDAGDISSDGDTMFITTVNQDLYLLDLTSVPVLPAVTQVPVTGDSGFVFDWAYNPTNGLLYGGDSSGGQLAILDPATGVRTDFNLVDTGNGTLPTGVAYGGSWFDASGRLFLYRNNGVIFEVDLAVPTIVDASTGPGSTRNDAAACVQSFIGGAKEMTASGGGLPETVTIDYLFENFSATAGLFNLSAIDDLVAVFGTHGVDWTFTSISSVPASFANPSFDGNTDTELINQTPTQGLSAAAIATVQVTIEVLTLDNVDADGQFCNLALITALNAVGTVFGDQSTAGSDPDPNGDGSPDEREPACVTAGRSNFACTGDAYIIQNVDAELTLVDQSVSPFVFIPVSGPTGIEINNLGLRRTDGLMYAVELAPNGNVQIVQIDAGGNVFGLGRPAGLPTGPRFDAGDISSDGSTMYITSNNQDLYLLDLTALPALPPVTTVTVSGSTGFVFDWAYNGADGLLYGGDSSSGQLAILDSVTGIRTDVSLTGLPAGVAYGGAWFGTSGNLFLFRNSGTIFEIDLSGPTIVGSQTGPGSTRNDAASCVP